MKYSFLFLTFFLLTSCSKKSGTDSILQQETAEINEKWNLALNTAENLDDSRLAARLIMTGIDSSGHLSDWEKERLLEIPVGAIMLFRKNLNGGSNSVKAMLDEIAVLQNDLKPFIAVDNEGGTVQRLSGLISNLKAPYSYWAESKITGTAAALKAVEYDAEAVGREMFALGITMNLAPTAEIINADNETFLGTRSYGSDPDFTSRAAAAFVRGMKKAGVSCVVKHFPGNTGTDPHLKTSQLTTSAVELENMISPFKLIIADENPAGIMVSHVTVKEWDDAHNASLSPFVIKEKLRNELSYNGIVMADDFSMGAVGGGYKTENAVVMSLKAGADMVMAWPRNLPAIHNAIMEAISAGVLDREQLVVSAARIIFAY